MREIRLVGAGRLLLGALIVPMLLTTFGTTGARAGAQAKVKVVTALTDHAWLVRTIGGSRVSVRSLLTGREDPHYASARPSLVLMVARADLFVDPGMELTVGYVPLILRSSRNKRVQVGSKGYVDASRYVRKMGVPANLTRAEGDVHPQGNPHYWVDPVAMIDSGRAILEGLARVDPAGEKLYRRRHREFVKMMIRKLVGEELSEKHVILLTWQCILHQANRPLLMLWK